MLLLDRALTYLALENRIRIYREFAKQSLMSAECAGDAKSRDVYMDMCANWHLLADESENVQVWLGEETSISENNFMNRPGQP